MKIISKIKNKIRSKKGESLAEVLIAVLISCLGLVLFASMIMASTDIITRSKTAFEGIVKKENGLETYSAVGSDVTESSGAEALRIHVGDGIVASTDPLLANVKAYTATIGGKTVTSYKVTD